jgi:hypothetical protein
MKQSRHYSITPNLIKGDEINSMETRVEDIIGKIQDTYSEIIWLYQSVPMTELLVEPALPNGWSVKDLLAHITAWELRFASLLEQAHDTNAPLKAMPEVDALNQEFYEERRAWTWEEVETEFRHAHKELLQEIEALPPARLHDPFVRESIAEETWLHYEEHLPDLRRWQQRISKGR